MEGIFNLIITQLLSAPTVAETAKAMDKAVHQGHLKMVTSKAKSVPANAPTWVVEKST